MKKIRQTKITELVQTHTIKTHARLKELLKDCGFVATQATISRDIREMKLTKTLTSDGSYKYTLPKSSREVPLTIERLMRIFSDGFVSMDYAGNILVIRTLDGMAMAVAAAIDSMGMPEIIGSLAGDNTVFCAVKGEEQAAALMRKLTEASK